ncbi:MAG: MBL fold metallo-hydrolase [Coriobacteriia bacterium]|nr:MBL fold metallo-hydrolase [Coriobacteriia bacterium]
MTTRLLYLGHSSLRITAADGRVLYIDPYAGEGYDKPADFILITHQHEDHNQIGLVTQKPDCRIITNEDALAGGKHNTLDLGDITVEAVEACNVNHDPKECVGYIITVDGIKLYCAGDTSKTEAMESFAQKELDYALLPIDGFYNMDLEEAVVCANLIGAKKVIPIHMNPGALFDPERAEALDVANKLIVAPGEEIVL